MDFQPLAIPEVILMTPKVWGDERGFFMETFRQSEFEKHCGKYSFVQDNHSKSSANILRGLHFQKTKPQGKLVRVIKGTVFDVAVDIRPNSSTFGQWVGEILSAENKRLLWVPPGFAHGFYVKSAEAEFVYKCSDYYAPEDEACIRYDDKDLGIDWGLSGEPLLSKKDEMGMGFREIIWK